MFEPHLTINLDDLLLDIATTIDPSDADYRIINKRYNTLKVHLERPQSPLAKYLQEDKSRIYAQGSVSISAVILSGEKDDRYDVDAMVEFAVPADWPDGRALDVLFEALQGFPGAEKIVRNTRCVTVQFAFMHMDVTIMDPASEPRVERIGDIFHSPDGGGSYRVPANPFGFSCWVRQSVHSQTGAGSFEEQVNNRRALNAVDRLQMSSLKAFDQDNLPPMIPPRMDAQQVVALKLMKRILNVEYSKRKVNKPPSIYITKKASDCGFQEAGLTSQLEHLARNIQNQMIDAIRVGEGPDERNPTYTLDRINDRWPQTQEDRRILHVAMGNVLHMLEKLKTANFSDIAEVLGEAFGEAISKKAVERHLERRDGINKSNVIKKAGTIVPETILTTPAIVKQKAIIPDHHFHCGTVELDDEDH